MCDLALRCSAKRATADSQLGAHGNPWLCIYSAGHGKGGESTGERSWETFQMLQMLGTFKPEREPSSAHLLSLPMLAEWFL